MKAFISLLIAAVVLAGTVVAGCSGNNAEKSAETPAGAGPVQTTTPGSIPEKEPDPGGIERITLGGGCFWCMEAIVEMVEGVTDAVSGYAGGKTFDPGYEEVCTGDTGHAEVVSVSYDPAAVTLEDVLDVFFASHDPTTLNRQGNDVGTQYRSVILYESEDHARRVEAYLEGIAERYDDPLTTEVAPLEAFYPAEEYHQDYYENNPDLPYSRAVIRPKVEKVKGMPGVP